MNRTTYESYAARVGIMAASTSSSENLRSAEILKRQPAAGFFRRLFVFLVAAEVMHAHA